MKATMFPKEKILFNVNMKIQLHREKPLSLSSNSIRIELGMAHPVWSPVFHLGSQSRAQNCADNHQE